MENNEIDLRDLLKLLYDKKRQFILITSFVGILSIVSAINSPNIYTSHAILAPSDTDESLSSQLGGLSSLTSFAGIRIPGEVATPAEEAIARLESFDFYSNHFLPLIKLEDLMAVDKWIPEENILIYDEKDFDSKKKIWIRDVSFPKTVKPSEQESYEKFLDHISIEEEGGTAFINISISHKSPFVAKKWLDVIISKINSSTRDIDINSANSAISFLSEYSESTNVKSLKEASSRLLETQMQKLMLASATDDYVFKVIESPLVPEEESGPNRILNVIFGLVVGSVMAFLVIILRNYRSLLGSKGS